MLRVERLHEADEVEGEATPGGSSPFLVASSQELRLFRWLHGSWEALAGAGTILMLSAQRNCPPVPRRVRRHPSPSRGVASK